MSLRGLGPYRLALWGASNRKQREELERQEEQRQQEKAMKDGTTDEARAEKERLEEVRGSVRGGLAPEGG